MPSFDVTIPSYNYGRYLGDCIRSVLEQDVESLRVLVVDNASTDDSLAVARDLAARDARVEVRAHDRNLGLHASFNEAIDWASGDYFVLLCADDLLVPGALRRAGEVLDADPALSFCCGRDIAIGEQDGRPELKSGAETPRWHRVSGKKFIEDACRRGAMDTPTAAIAVRTQKLKRIGYFRQLSLEDHEFWLRLATVGDVAEMENVQASIRYHGGNMALRLSSTQMILIEQISEAVESFFAHEGAGLPDRDRLYRLARQGVASRAYWAALAAWARGSESGSALMWYALRHRPIAALLPPVGYVLDRKDGFTRVAEALKSLSARLGVPKSA